MHNSSIIRFMNDIKLPDHARLFDVASSQSGYFTSAQAQHCGFSHALLAHHAAEGRFERVRRGLYRLRDYPSHPHEEVVAAWLAAGTETAVVSHESALEVLGLSDIVPGRVHLTVPRSQRGRRAIPGVKMHTTQVALDDNDVVIRNGVRLTNAVRSIVDVIKSGVAPEQAMLAAHQALERGIATRSQLRERAAREGGLVERLLERALVETSAE